MKLIIQNLKTNKSGYAQLMPLGDIHYGADNCRLDKVKEKIDQCIREKIYVIGMGDMIEMATKSSPGTGVFDQSNPTSQVEGIIDLFQPLHDAGLLLGIHEGNHEQRTTKVTGIDVTKMMCRAIGTKYLGYTNNLLLRAGTISYTVHSTHGRGSSGTTSGKINRASKCFSNYHCDLILFGHLHGLKYNRDSYYYINKKRKVLEKRDRFVVLTGSFLKYLGGYADMMGLSPAPVGAPLISFDPKDFNIKVDIC